jgi:hypothetical protein
MFIAMNRFRVAKGSEAAFEQVWMSRDSHLDKVPGLWSFTFSRAPRLRITPSMPLTRCGKAGLCSRHGPNQRRSRVGHSKPLYLDHLQFERCARQCAARW